MNALRVILNVESAIQDTVVVKVLMTDLNPYHDDEDKSFQPF